MLRETCDLLVTNNDGIYVDCTFGGGGHSTEILKLLSENGRLFAFDCDDAALERGAALAESDKRFSLEKGRFSQLKENAERNSISGVDGITMDLGTSSFQLFDPERGFSFMRGEDLDMRLDQQQELTAYDVVNGYGEEDLVEIFKTFSDLKSPYNVAAMICKRRMSQPFETCSELANFIKTSTKAGKVEKKKIHPATQVFQAIRMEVNCELKEIQEGLETAVSLLRTGGRLAVITFHSIEDRLVKNYFRQENTDCLCNKYQIVCVCGHTRSVKLITRKPMAPSNEETRENPASRSAKLRVVEKL